MEYVVSYIALLIASLKSSWFISTLLEYGSVTKNVFKSLTYSCYFLNHCLLIQKSKMFNFIKMWLAIPK